MLGRYDDGMRLPLGPGDISGFDSSVISITGNKITPLRVGTSQLLVNLPNRIDTLLLRVESEEGGLAVYSDK